MHESPKLDAEPISTELLRPFAIFAGITDAQLGKLIPLVRIQECAAQAELLRQGEPAHELYVVVTGKFSLCLELGAGAERCLLTVSRGEVLGWSAVLDGASWVASATAVKPSSVLAIPSASLKTLCESDHELGYRLMRNLFAAIAARLHDTRLQLLDLYGHA